MSKEAGFVDLSKDPGFRIKDWSGYPEGELKPIGNLRILQGEEYEIARKAANSANASLRNSNPSFFKGLEIHEIQPIKFNGSPTEFSNKLFLTPQEHRQFNSFWMKIQRNP